MDYTPRRRQIGAANEIKPSRKFGPNNKYVAMLNFTYIVAIKMQYNIDFGHSG